MQKDFFNRGKYNKGEWSELYAFIKLLYEGNIFAADEHGNRIDDVRLPIIKIIRQELDRPITEYHIDDVEDTVTIHCGWVFQKVTKTELLAQSELLLKRILKGSLDGQRTFSVDEVSGLLSKLMIINPKSPSNKKYDIVLEVREPHTGISSIQGFSIKSYLGSPSSLFNAGKNTRIQYEVQGLTPVTVSEINSIDHKTREHIKARISKLFSLAGEVRFSKVKDKIFNNNLMMIDSLMPKMYGDLMLQHYINIEEGIYRLDMLIDRLKERELINERDAEILTYKCKKLLTSFALGMTAGSQWNGLDNATGGYIIVKPDGEVLCYYLRNRDSFEQYLFNNISVDRPSSTRHDWGYLYEENGNTFIDLNLQLRFNNFR